MSNRTTVTTDSRAEREEKMTDVLSAELPGYRTGRWVLDPAHSCVSFAARHLMITTVRGVFAVASATIVVSDDPLDTRVSASVDVSSLDTKDPDRDAHLLSADFLDVEQFPTMDFVSTGVRVVDGRHLLDGELTIRGVTRPVTFDFEFGGFALDPWGEYRAGAKARTTIDREDFGLVWNVVLETGGLLVGKEVVITLDIEGTLPSE